MNRSPGCSSAEPQDVGKVSIDHASVLRVLHVTPTFYPATRWGGPIVSTKALCDGLARRSDVKLRVLSTDAAGPRRSERVEVENPVWFEAGYEVRYERRLLGVSVSLGLVARLPRLVAWADVVHVTGVYSFPTLPTLALAAALGKPVVWSPRGALQASAEWSDVRRKGRKLAFERAAVAVSPQRMLLLTTSELERRASAERMPGLQSAVIPNIVEIPKSEDHKQREWKPAGLLRLLFLGRLHPIKGLDTLLDALAMLPDRIRLDVFGDTEDSQYLAALKEKVATLGLESRVAFHGETGGSAKDGVFANADLLVLPTFHENFGIVVAEALAHGVPVVTTRKAPWHGLEENDCGCWVEPKAEALAAAIHELDTRDLAAMGQRGRAWVKRAFSEAGATEALVSLYRELLTGTRNNCK